MIIKSSQRAGHQELAAHLMKHRDIDGTPQTVTMSGSRGLVDGNDVQQALSDMAILAMASSRCQKDLYHVSLSPDQSMTGEDWETVWQLYESEFGLNHLPYIEVTHAKGDNRPPHRHRVYERVDTETCKALQLSHTYIRNELVARKIEFMLGHHLTIGKHNRTVIKRLEQDGEQEMIAWMQQGHAHTCDRPVANQNHDDVQMAKRTKLSTEQVKADLQACYAQTDNGQSFRVAIAEKGYQLARGSRRDFVIVDAMGGIHSPRRRLGVKAKDLRQRWADLAQINLAHVDDVVRQIKAQITNSNTQDNDSSNVTSDASTAANDIAGQGSGVDSLPALRQESDNLASEIETLEATIAANDAKQIEEEALNYWQRQGGIDGAAESERSRPRSKVQHQRGRGGQSTFKSTGIKNEAELLQLQGQDAISERQRRLLALSQLQSHPQSGNVIALNAMSNHAISNLNEAQALQRGITDYQRFWQERFKGQTAQQLSASQAYRLGSDRWILKRLARRGYSRTQARQILMRSSPELLNQRPHERLGYIRRMVHQVYTPHEQQQRLAIIKENSKHSKTRTNARDIVKPNRPETAREKTIPKEQPSKSRADKAIDRSPDNGLER